MVLARHMLSTQQTLAIIIIILLSPLAKLTASIHPRPARRLWVSNLRENLIRRACLTEQSRALHLNI